MENLNENKDVLVELKNLSVRFPVKGHSLFKKKEFVEAVTDVNLSIEKGDIFGVVGESGCGKTTLANTILGIVNPSSGQVKFHNQDINEIPKKDFLELRRNMQMIFQDPFSSLNPRFTVYDLIAEPYLIRKNISKEKIKDHVIELLELVGLSKEDLYRYPSDFSGGQRQRIGIARAIALHPEFLVCDEPVSALDVSVHAQILNLLMDLQKELNLTYLFISHNLAVVKKVCTKVAVMYLGKIVEIGTVQDVFKRPLHPYTRALMSAVLNTDFENKNKRIILKGEIPSPINPPPGCRFSKRCNEGKPTCGERKVCLIEVEPGHFVACHQFH